VPRLGEKIACGRRAIVAWNTGCEMPASLQVVTITINAHYYGGLAGLRA